MIKGYKIQNLSSQNPETQFSGWLGFKINEINTRQWKLKINEINTGQGKLDLLVMIEIQKMHS